MANIKVDRESRKEFMELIESKIKNKINDWVLNYNNNIYSFHYTAPNNKYTFNINSNNDGDVKYTCREGGDAIDIYSSESCSLLKLILTIGLPCFFLFIPVWGVHIMLTFQVVSSFMVIMNYINSRKFFRVLKKEYKRRKRLDLLQRINSID